MQLNDSIYKNIFENETGCLAPIREDYFLFSTDSVVERNSIFGYKTPRRLRDQSGKIHSF
ncbi:hypothetical protein [Leptospira borgpetersenii]|uniref:Uncharacterized protein n=3 Tax=Leptospira borgpetersenii TaxID=174 RepID=M3GDZ5_LEPBO|nr:hypothetical protein [Leptospira borgpetersenii]EMF99166.1 hypothetical protein LEP1GSC123_3434 [Leptospira borgpetersenii str. 200701203]EMK11989.1 hypothetical protein LEP1GSC066_1478 [Leptospira sp. serovar Kenya str. Sh9]EMN12416.1 hypothetical protein LEP1GSC055_1731 [Leptospira borgpetersenii str. Brem 307]EMN17347.1 hypothetical protein LEP1GSC056_1297 [Leptospira borgpetersenii str. Brem 328]EKP13830.1 hypothetical protein LEP1GSC128_0663 [Leptospira borgpetersenii str. 200801926]